MNLFVSHEILRATLHRQNSRLTADSPETAFRLRRLVPISINASARSTSSLSGGFQESFQRSVRNEQPTCGKFVATQTALPLGCPAATSRCWRGEAANEDPDTGSHHLVVERVDIAGYRFGLCGRVVVVGVVNSDQMLRHDFSVLL